MAHVCAHLQCGNGGIVGRTRKLVAASNHTYSPVVALVGFVFEIWQNTVYPFY